MSFFNPTTNKKNQVTHKKQKPKRHLLKKAIGLGLLGTATAATTTVLGGWGAWQYAKMEAQNRRRHTPAFNTVITANTYCGLVHKDAHNFTLTTASATYHVVDGLAIIEKLAKQHADNLPKNSPAMSDYYDFEVCVLGELSKKGHYGYLGHLDYQLTIVGVPE